MKEIRKRRPSRAWMTIGVVLLVASYSLSMGPVSDLIRQGYLHPAWIRGYEPLAWVADHSPGPINAVLLWSFRQWLPADDETLPDW